MGRVRHRYSRSSPASRVLALTASICASHLKPMLFSKLLGNPVVFCANHILPICALKAANREMTLSDILKVLDECIIDRSATESSGDWQSLRSELLRHDQAEARRDLGNEFEQDRRSLLDNATLGNEPSGFGNSLCEHSPNRKISALRCVVGAGAPAEREDFDTGESSLRIRQVLPLALGYVCDGPQHNHGRDRQLDRKRC